MVNSSGFEEPFVPKGLTDVLLLLLVAVPKELNTILKEDIEIVYLDQKDQKEWNFLSH